mmetsp:Transcript_11081/g.11175  ORF Transcript_11081/g.11175 Transcript_11081/m.11175 type:complete len:138 (-) Transcript_11081:110-523(-)
MSDKQMVPRYSGYLNNIFFMGADKFIASKRKQYKTQVHEDIEDKSLNVFERMKVDALLRQQMFRRLTTLNQVYLQSNLKAASSKNSKLSVSQSHVSSTFRKVSPKLKWDQFNKILKLRAKNQLDSIPSHQQTSSRQL